MIKIIPFRVGIAGYDSGYRFDNSYKNIIFFNGKQEILGTADMISALVAAYHR